MSVDTENRSNGLGLAGFIFSLLGLVCTAGVLSPGVRTVSDIARRRIAQLWVNGYFIQTEVCVVDEHKFGAIGHKSVLVLPNEMTL